MQRLKDKLNPQLLLQAAAKLDSMITALTKVGVAVIGYQANKSWTGSLTALIALRLAESNNLAAGVAGVATLTAIGLGAIPRTAQTSGRLPGVIL